MSGNSEPQIVDADCHILEPPDIWKTWLPERFSDQAPQLVKDADGGDAWQFAGTPAPDPIGLVSTPGKPFDEFRWTGVTYDDARPGCYDGAQRLADMDIDGVHAELLFPPQRTIGHFLGDEDDDFVRAGVEAYNNFLWEEFCEPDRSRLVGIAQIPSTGVDDAVDSLRKAKARGFKGVVISCWPTGGEGLDPDSDPFWAAAEEEEMPVCVHINIISRVQRQKSRQAAAKRLAYEAEDRAEDKAEGKEKGAAATRGATKAKAVGGLGSVFTMTAGVIGNLIFTGVFDRFPKLHLSMIECGVGWIPHYLEQLDDRYWRNRGWGEIDLVHAPSHYWRHNMSATFIQDRTGLALRHEAGVDTIMWSSDYPHHGNDWPYSRKVIAEQMVNVPQDERALMVGGNATRIFGLD